MNNAKTVAGIPLPLYLGILALTFASMYTGSVPGGMVGGFLVLLVVGEGLNYAGKTIPVVRTYLGGSVICILGGAILTATGILGDMSSRLIHLCSTRGEWPSDICSTQRIIISGVTYTGRNLYATTARIVETKNVTITIRKKFLIFFHICLYA